MSRSDLSVERVRHHLKMRMLIVPRGARGRLMARVTFTGVDLQDFVSPSALPITSAVLSVRSVAAAGPAQRHAGGIKFPTTRRA